MRKITNELIQKVKAHLIDQEKSSSTLEKYIRDITVFMEWCKETELCKSIVLDYKQAIVEKYAPASVNSILSSINSFFASKDKELTKAEYYLLQDLCQLRDMP